MNLDADTYYSAILARDGRFDGVFFTGIVSTGVYCRPVCPAKTPNKVNCRFFPTATSAEAAGFRPCMRCRPELSPAVSDGNRSSIVQRAFTLLQSGEYSDYKIGEIAAELGLSERQLRRLFLQECGLPPIAFAQTQRMLFAKRLLQETPLSMADVAFSAGFGSVRRFNTLFRDRYGLVPSDMRGTRVSPISDTIALRMAYRPPFAWQQMLDFLAMRAIAGVENVSDGAYYRSVEIDGHQGWLKVEHLAGKNSLLVTLPTTLTPVLMVVLARLRRLFDLDANPLVIAEHLSADPRLSPLIQHFPGLRVPGAWDGFELAVRAVLGQQVSVRGASTLATRLAKTFGKPSVSPHNAINRISPEAQVLAAASPEQIAVIGLPLKRAVTLQALARAVAVGEIRLHSGADAEQAIEKLKMIAGIGDWTAQYIVMRAVRWPDAFPAGDLGLLKAVGLGGPKGGAGLLPLAEKWRPWRAYAAMYLWSSLPAAPAKRDIKGETG
jgi:AraC family transcriptional regulator of adaptative response / DNA-3-methyladenine glycosylase II